MKLRATILGTGKTSAGIQIPGDVVASLGSSRKPAVCVTINGYTYRSSMAFMGGVFMLGVSNEVRAAAGVRAGQDIDLESELDTEPRELTVPVDVAAALDAEPAARRFFDGLSYSNRRRIVIAIDDAKTPETRARRIEKSVAMLREGGTAEPPARAAHALAQIRAAEERVPVPASGRRPTRSGHPPEIHSATLSIPTTRHPTHQ